MAAHDTAATALHERLGRHRMATVAQEWGPHVLVDVHCRAAPDPHPPHSAGHPR
ncbi:hypothetical protein [Streptomyces sp. NPDC093105]|uniref:hypothetical protein n=1 Tax=Streptomyces sp. NPDC093105 TaxID=3366029 RepID=UPI00382E2CBC